MCPGWCRTISAWTGEKCAQKKLKQITCSSCANGAYGPNCDHVLVVEEYHNVLDMGNVLMVFMAMGHAIVIDIKYKGLGGWGGAMQLPFR